MMRRMAQKNPIGPRRNTIADASDATAASAQPVIDPKVTPSTGAVRRSASDLIADNERDDEPAHPGEVPTSITGATGTVGGVAAGAGVPVPEEVSFGFGEKNDTDVAADLGGGIESRLPSALTRRADQLDAFQQEVSAGAEDPGPARGVDRSMFAIGGDRIVETTERSSEGYSSGRRAYYADDGSESYMRQSWTSDGGYGERYGTGSWAGSDIDPDGNYMEFDTLDDGSYVIRQDDGTVKVWSDSEMVTYHPNGDVELNVEGDREVHHADGSSHVYKENGQVIFTPPPQQGTGGGEGEGETAPQQTKAGGAEAGGAEAGGGAGGAEAGARRTSSRTKVVPPAREKTRAPKSRRRQFRKVRTSTSAGWARCGRSAGHSASTRELSAATARRVRVAMWILLIRCSMGVWSRGVRSSTGSRP